jgi:hypothetical protein
MIVGRWTARLRQIQEFANEAGGPSDKSDKSPSVTSVTTPPGLVPEIDLLPNADVQPPSESPADPLAAAALAELVIDRALRRSGIAELAAQGYRVGIAVRVPAGGYATAVLSVPTSDGVAILEAFQRAARQ